MCKKCRENALAYAQAPRRSLLVQTLEEVDMSDELVPLNLNASVTLPQRLVLPSVLMRRHQVDRQLMITKRQQKVPAGILSWMRNDPRYAIWFADPLLVEPTALADASPEASEGEQGEAKTDREKWSESMVAPVLRDYAVRHSVSLAKEDRKSDVVAKLRKAGLPEEKAATP
jgi:hypothetical protein